MTEFEYYWEKAEFQDPVSHRAHVENYKKGIRDSIVFDEQYQKEAELEKENEKNDHNYYLLFVFVFGYLVRCTYYC